MRVRAETDLQVTGPQARFGRGDHGGRRQPRARRVRAAAARRRSRPPSRRAGVAAAASAPAPLPPVDDAFDMGAAIAQTAAARVARRVAPLVIAALALLVLLAPAALNAGRRTAEGRGPAAAPLASPDVRSSDYEAVDRRRRGCTTACEGSGAKTSGLPFACSAAVIANVRNCLSRSRLLGVRRHDHVRVGRDRVGDLLELLASPSASLRPSWAASTTG